MKRMGMRAAGLIGLTSLLVACGGGQGGTQSSGDAAPVQAQAREASGSEGNAQAEQELARGADLNARSLKNALQRAQSMPVDTDLQTLAPGALAPIEAYTQGEVARKAEVVRAAVFRFYNVGTGVHFYTSSVDEREQVYRSMPLMNPEGDAFYAASTESVGLSPVHRFYNTAAGVHFYTISEDEKAYVQATLPSYQYEGVAYYASQVPAAGFIPLYRFLHRQKGVHFYTASAAERQSVQDNMAATYQYEGIGYYVMEAACASPPCGSSGPNRPRVFIALHGNNELANNAALDGLWTYVRQNVHGIWGNDANISFDESAKLIRKLNTRNFIKEAPLPSGTSGFTPLADYMGVPRLYPDIVLNPEAIALYTSDPSRWNVRTVAQAEAIYTDPTAPDHQRFGAVYTGWQPYNFDPTHARYLYANNNAVLAFRSSKGTFVECLLTACNSGKNGAGVRKAIRETHVRGRPFIWFASNNSGSAGWLAKFQGSYNAIAAEGLWRSDDVVMIINYGGVYPKVPEAVGGVAADTATGLAYWAIQQRVSASIGATLVNATARRDLLPLQGVQGQAVSLNQGAAARFDVRAQGLPAGTRSVVLGLSRRQDDGQWVELRHQVDSEAPFQLSGEAREGATGVLLPGLYRVRIEAFDQTGAQGQRLGERIIDWQVAQ